MIRLFRSASMVGLVCGLGACASAGRSPEPQALEPQKTPSAFAGAIAKDAPIWPSADWWAGFKSPELNDLVLKAQVDNLDVAAAAAQVLQAQAQSKITAAALFPSVDLQASAQRTQTGAGAGGRSATTNAFGLSLDASYQADLWGRTRAQVRSADQLLLASRYARETVALTITADVASTYLDILALRQRIDIAQKNLDAARRILIAVQSRVRNGTGSRLDLAQQETQVQSAEATIPPLQEQEREARYALAILLARPPEQFDVQAQTLDGIAAPDVAPGLPSELLRRRPDVAEAEANLASAYANVDAARAAFLPQIGLTASGGFTSTALKSLLSGPDFGWSLGASLLQPIFDGGQLKGQLALTEAQQQQLVATYRKTTLTAFSDVETALGQTSSLAEQDRERTAQAAAAAEAFAVAERQYDRGVTDLLTLLTTEQALFSAQDELVQIRLAKLQADVGLYQALGGGWTEQTNEVRQLSRVEAFPPGATLPVR